MVDIIDWPGVLKPIDATIPFLSDSVTSSGPTITGNEGVVEGLAARWNYGFRFKIWTRDEHLLWRAIMARARGRAVNFRVPICDCKFSPRFAGVDANISTQALVPHSDNTPHSDDTPFDQDGTASTLTNAAAAGATQITVTTVASIDIHPGHYVSDGNRFYSISSSTQLNATTWSLTVAPRLRKAIPAGAALSFNRIFCLMRLTEDSSLNVSAELLKFADHQISFIEAVA